MASQRRRSGGQMSNPDIKESMVTCVGLLNFENQTTRLGSQELGCYPKDSRSLWKKFQTG